MRYGLQIGLKFDQGGKPLYYPGNTVIADVEKDNPAYDVTDILMEYQRKSELFLHIKQGKKYSKGYVYFPLTIDIAE